MSLKLQSSPRRRFSGLALLGSLALVQGCSQPEPGHPANPTSHASTVQNQPPARRETALRVVVKFRTGGTGRDAAVLSGLTRQAQAPVSYLASVSADTHVYRIEPAAGQSTGELLARLRAMPGVAFVEIDNTVRNL